jgi:hypothetical protein
MTVWAPVQGRLRALIDVEIADARTRIIELERFATELERVASGLDAHTPDGPCDDACGCITEPTVVVAEPAVRTKPPRAVTR